MGKIFNKNIITTKDLIRKETQKHFKENIILSRDYEIIHLKDNGDDIELGIVSKDLIICNNLKLITDFRVKDVKTNDILQYYVYKNL